jgi:hypothetical protein
MAIHCRAAKNSLCGTYMYIFVAFDAFVQATGDHEDRQTHSMGNRGENDNVALICSHISVNKMTTQRKFAATSR